MSIRKGDRAHPFALPVKLGEMVDVGAHIGKEPVVLLFFPLAFSPVCSTEMCTMRDEWSEWEDLDAHVFGITADSPFVTAKFREELSIPFPILSDFNREVATKYGALHDDLKGLKRVPKRAVFVIGADGKVKYDWVSENPGTLPNFAEVKAAIASGGRMASKA